MPYKIQYHKGAKRPWQVVKKSTGKVVGTSLSRAKAVASIAARSAKE